MYLPLDMSLHGLVSVFEPMHIVSVGLATEHFLFLCCKLDSSQSDQLDQANHPFAVTKFQLHELQFCLRNLLLCFQSCTTRKLTVARRHFARFLTDRLSLTVGPFQGTITARQADTSTLSNTRTTANRTARPIGPATPFS